MKLGGSAALALAVTLATTAAFRAAQPTKSSSQPSAACAGCHRTPPADVLPRAAWREEILRMERIRTSSETSPDAAITLPNDFVAALTWYERHAPERLARTADWPSPSPQLWSTHAMAPPQAPPTPVISDVELADVDRDGRPELIVCDMRQGMVFLGHPAAQPSELTLIAKVSNPARAQVVDLDRDGIDDILVADLGEFLPRDHDKGAAVWLRGLGQGRFAPFGVGGLPRIADVEAADFDGDGDLDLLVSAFGYRKTGSIMILENRTVDWHRPALSPVTIDPRPGAVRALPIDLDGDSRMDFVSVVSQQFEEVVAYHNEGGLKFKAEILYQAPHPNWGSSGMSLADLDGDGDQDILLANGDTFDDSLLKPYHGLAWLERVGAGRDVRFTYHRLADVPGPHGIVAADLDGDGDLDVLASCLIAGGAGSDDERLPGVVWMEQVALRRFERRTLKAGLPRHATVAAGDYDGDGDVDVVFGNMATTGPMEAWVELWENTTKRSRQSAAGGGQ
jgi:FG-GAP-like repeat